MKNKNVKFVTGLSLGIGLACLFLLRRQRKIQIEGLAWQKLRRPARFLLLEETTGVPSFPGLETQPAPGTMRNPGGYNNGTDFTVIYRRIDLPASGGE